jgi:hypothetical protein
MKTLSLNCRGLGNLQIVNELHSMVKQKGPNIVFLMETRLPVRSLEWLRVRLGMLGCFGVERNGTGGGLALLWDATVTVNIQSYSTHHIDVDVIQQEGVHWRLTGFYGHPERALRYHSWNLLRHLCQSQVSPWLVLGDFNEIMQLEEKWGGQDRSVAQMTAFREALSDCLLQDLGIKVRILHGLMVGKMLVWCE